MSNDEKVRMVTPTGRIVFHKNLFVSGGEKDRFSAALVFSKDQDVTTIKKLMMDCAKAAGYDKKTVTSPKFAWGLKAVDTKELDFCNEGDMIINFDRNGSFGPPEVKGKNKGPDGKYEDLIDGDIGAGDHCRILISAFAWEYKGKSGVKLNFDAVQFVKKGEPYYSIPTSDDAWDDVAIDVEVPEVLTESADETDAWGEEAF